MEQEPPLRFSGQEAQAILLKHSLHSHALLIAILRMEAEILAKLTDSDLDETWRYACWIYESYYDEHLALTVSKHGDVELDVAGTLASLYTKKGGKKPSPEGSDDPAKPPTP